MELYNLPDRELKVNLVKLLPEVKRTMNGKIINLTNSYKILRMIAQNLWNLRVK
jgi:hypothetical protein